MEMLVGFLIGAAIGITGVGGGVVTAPVLIIFFGLSPAQSVGTALIYSAAVKVNALAVYLVRRQVKWVVLAWLLVGGVPGALLGSLLLMRLSGTQSRGIILTAVGATVMVTSLYSLRRRKDAEEAERENRVRLLPWFTFPIGLEVGFSSAGAGALGSVLMLRCTNLAPAMVVGTDLLFGLAVSTAGGGMQVAAGNYDRAMLMKLLIGGLVGAPLGAASASRVPASVLRVAILIWAAVLGALLLLKGLSW